MLEVFPPGRAATLNRAFNCFCILQGYSLNYFKTRFFPPCDGIIGFLDEKEGDTIAK